MTKNSDLPPHGGHARFWDDGRPAWTAPDVLGSPPVMLAAWEEQLRWQARDAIPKGEHRLAVLLSQVACELQTRGALISLLSRRMEPQLAESVVGQLRGSCLDDGKLRRFWFQLTRDNPAGNPDKSIERTAWWDDWIIARELRDEIAHRAPVVGMLQAQAAYDAAEKYIEHVKSVAAPKPAAAP